MVPPLRKRLPGLLLTGARGPPATRRPSEVLAADTVPLLTMSVPFALEALAMTTVLLVPVETRPPFTVTVLLTIIAPGVLIVPPVETSRGVVTLMLSVEVTEPQLR